MEKIEARGEVLTVEELRSFLANKPGDAIVLIEGEAINATEATVAGYDGKIRIA